MEALRTFGRRLKDERWRGYWLAWCWFFVFACLTTLCLLAYAQDPSSESVLFVSLSIVGIPASVIGIHVEGEEAREAEAREKDNQNHPPLHFNARSMTVTATMVEDPEPPEPPELPERETDTPLVGWKAWRLRLFEEKAWLQSLHTRTDWMGPVLRASGEPSSYDPHDPRWKDRDDHEHGIYAFDGRVAVSELGEYSGLSVTTLYANGLEAEYNGNAMAVGEVDLLGKVVVHDRGYRAERARVRRIVISGMYRDTEVPERLSERYQCPVEFADEVERIGKEQTHGTDRQAA